MLKSIITSASGGDAGLGIDLAPFGAFGIVLAFGWWILRDVMRERDKARDLADRQAKSIDSMERVLVAIQGTMAKFEGGLDDLTDSLRNLPHQVEVERLNQTLSKVEGIIGENKQNG